MIDDFLVGLSLMTPNVSIMLIRLKKKIRKNWIGKQDKCEVITNVSLAGLNL